MRKTAAAVTVGLLLVAGQAAALNTQTAARVGDRVGARADAASDFTQSFPVSRVPFFSWTTAFIAAAGITAIVVATNDGGDS